MFILAHIGIGQTLAAPFSRDLPKRPLILGTLLPDLIDKPIYYGGVLLYGRTAMATSLIAGTRTFAHTAIFLLILCIIAALRKWRAMSALALGVAPHLLLDNLGNPFAPHVLDAAFRTVTLLWPLQGWYFPRLPYSGLPEQVSQVVIQPFFFWTEVLGLILILWQRWKAQNRREIVQFIRQSHQERRRDRRKRRRWRRRPD